MEQIPSKENKRFNSLEEFQNFFEHLYESEKRQEDVSHLTFGETFNAYDLVAEDLEIWNFSQDYFENLVSFNEFMGRFRAYQLNLFNENLTTSSRGKFSSYLSSMVTKKHLEDSRLPSR